MLEKQIKNGEYLFKWETEVVHDEHVIRWISDKLNLSFSQTLLQFDSYLSNLSHYMNQGNKLEWGGWGILEKSTDGNFYFHANAIYPVGLNTAPAEKTIREKAEHQVLVGDQTFTSDDMREKLRNPIFMVGKRWMIISAACIVTAIFVLTYFFVVDQTMIDRHQQQPSIKAKTAMPTYKILSKDE
jgi:hypothetical protein